MKLHIESITEATTKKGNHYLRVKSNQGSMSCFDADTCYTLSQLKYPCDLDLEVVEKDGYWTIQGINGNETPVKPSSSMTDKNIRAQVAFKGAIDMVCAGKSPEVTNTDGTKRACTVDELTSHYYFMLESLVK